MTKTGGPSVGAGMTTRDRDNQDLKWGREDGGEKAEDRARTLIKWFFAVERSRKKRRRKKELVPRGPE